MPTDNSFLYASMSYEPRGRSYASPLTDQGEKFPPNNLPTRLHNPVIYYSFPPLKEPVALPIEEKPSNALTELFPKLSIATKGELRLRLSHGKESEQSSYNNLDK